jgi:hypothetical protein
MVNSLKTEEKERIHAEIEAGAKEVIEKHGVEFRDFDRGIRSMGDVVIEVHSSIRFPLRGNNSLIKELESMGWKLWRKQKEVSYDPYSRIKYAGYKMFAVMWKGRGVEWKEPL